MIPLSWSYKWQTRHPTQQWIVKLWKSGELYSHSVHNYYNYIYWTNIYGSRTFLNRNLKYLRNNTRWVTFNPFHKGSSLWNQKNFHHTKILWNYSWNVFCCYNYHKNWEEINFADLLLKSKRGIIFFKLFPEHSPTTWLVPKRPRKFV